MRRRCLGRMIALGLDNPLRGFASSPKGDDSIAAGRPLLAVSWLGVLDLRSVYWRAVRTLAGRAPGWLVRKGLMSRPPRRV